MTSLITKFRAAIHQPKPLKWYISAPLPIFAVLTLVSVLTVVPRAMEGLVKENAVDTAVELTKTLQKIRDYYAEHVLSNVNVDNGVEITHLHRLSDNSIPIPATFLIEMAQTKSDNQKLDVTITSPFPFESRKNRVLDEFQRDAWLKLNAAPEIPVSQFETSNNRRVVRVALPDKLTKTACVDCHNSHQDSQKRDWKLGDVRGLVEISVDVESNLERANQISFIIIMFSFISLLLVILFNLRLAKKIIEPLSSITSAITALSERNFVNIKTKRNDYKEVKILNDAFENLQQNEGKRLELEREVRNLAYFDTLTGLPNRISMMNFLSEQIEGITSQTNLSFMIVNIEKLNEVNDTLGYEVGDQVLQEFAKRIEKECTAAFIAKFDSTEFAISLIEKSNENTREVATDLLKTLQVPVFVKDNELHLDVSIGISFTDKTSTKVSDVISEANIALHQSQLDNGTNIVFYNPELSEQLHERVTMIKDLKHALENRELVPYFQPQLDLATNKLVGAEVLLRWKKQDGSMIPPFKFIPVAERSRLIIPIGHYVLTEACRLTKHWQEQGLPKFRVAVNVSGVQFEEENIVCEVEEVLNQTGLSANYLELEVTETALMSDMKEIIRKLTELRNLGVELAIDDFGTGYSSLSYLKKLPIHRLKIDQAFVRNIITSKDDQAITKMILGLGHAMNLKVLAEGVEGQEEEAFLKKLKCDEAQGYYYAKPMPAEEFERYLNNIESANA